MKILVIGPGKMKYMPYSHFYLDNINRKKHEIHVAYWNRDEREEDLTAFDGLHLHEFRKYMVNDAPLRTKIRLFYAFRKFCLSLINQYEFDYIIVLHSIPAIALYDKLTGIFKGRFIFDYRDSTYESRIWAFKNAVGNLIRCSEVTFTSSDGFREYFPDDCQQKIITSHNLLEDSLLHRDYQKFKSDKIRIAFWGFIRHVEMNKYLQDRIGNDDRYELHYYGREQIDAQRLKEYAHSKNYRNVIFHGEYMPLDRYEFVKSTDIIHNIYLDSNTMRAMGNKYYDGLIFRIPQVCFPNSQMSIMSEAAGVGIPLDPRDEEFCNKLYTYYTNLNRTLYNKCCDIELNRVLREYSMGRQKLLDIFMYDDAFVKNINDDKQ